MGIEPEVFAREFDRLVSEEPKPHDPAYHFLAGAEVEVVMTDTTMERNELKRMKVVVPEYHRVGEELVLRFKL